MWTRLCEMADLRRLGGDEVGGQLLGRCLSASPHLDIASDGAEPARARTLARALGQNGNPQGLAQVALDLDGGASDSDFRMPVCGREVQQFRRFETTARETTNRTNEVLPSPVA